MWIYQDVEFNPSYSELKCYEGYVYLITNTENNKKYIGKKGFHSHRKLAGATRKKTLESDWRKYYSSSDEIKDEIKLIGKDKFKRTILKLCGYKKQMSYWETKLQWEFDVLFGDEWYNSNISSTYYKKERYIYDWINQ